MIVLELAQSQHWADLFVWRNDAVTRASSIQTEVIPLKDHLQWFTKALADSNVYLYIGRDPITGDKIGTGKLEHKRSTVSVSIIVAPHHRGHGYGTMLVHLLTENAKRLLDGHKKPVIEAIVRETNGRSLCAFADAGYVVRAVNPDGLVELVVPC